jgi:hypothetical protein
MHDFYNQDVGSTEQVIEMIQFMKVGRMIAYFHLDNIGMLELQCNFSALFKVAPNMTLRYLSCRPRH